MSEASDVALNKPLLIAIDGPAAAAARGKGREGDRQHHEGRGQHGGGPAQEIGRAACRHEAGRAPSGAKTAAFRLLHQDDTDQQGGNDRLDDHEKDEHVANSLSGVELCAI